MNQMSERFTFCHEYKNVTIFVPNLNRCKHVLFLLLYYFFLRFSYFYPNFCYFLTNLCWTACTYPVPFPAKIGLPPCHQVRSLPVTSLLSGWKLCQLSQCFYCQCLFALSFYCFHLHHYLPLVLCRLKL